MVGVGNHLYTTSALERDLAVSTYGFISETMPCYLYASSLRAQSDHLYTTSEAERDQAVNTYDYVLETMPCYVFDHPAPDTVQLYRLSNAEKGDHLYTTSKIESDLAVQDHGYILETMPCYVFDHPAPDTVQLYRLSKEKEPPIRQAVAGFLPSTSGLHFSNIFASGPLLKIDILGQKIPIGDASNGLCGGMVFTVRDYFDAGRAVPSGTSSPSSGPLFDYIVARLFDSFNLRIFPPPGPVIYMGLMNPMLPDHETDLSRAGLAPHGRSWVMVHDEWPKIKADLDSNRLSPIGLIEIKSLDPFQMGKNHQILAYGYDLDGTDLTIHVYDPNYPDDNGVTISLSIANPYHTTKVTYSRGATVWCFFRPDYKFSSPP
jgi:hypothetical protein